LLVWARGSNPICVPGLIIYVREHRDSKAVSSNVMDEEYIDKRGGSGEAKCDLVV
jgi:hypothetical protein